MLVVDILVFAQQDFSVIKGNVGVENVNISVVNTNFGASTDDKGNFILTTFKLTKQVDLLFTCIGYQDTLVSVVLNCDTIEINFKMREVSYILDAVGVSAETITMQSEEKYVMYDFEIFDDKIFILQRKGNTLKECRILVNDLLLDPIDTIFIPNHIEPEKLFIDCLECCQILGVDSVFQIVNEYNGNNYIINYATELNYYNKVMNNIIFMTRKYVYFKENTLDGYVTYFYRIGFDTKEKEIIIVCNDTESYKKIKEERMFHAKYKLPWGAPSVDDWEEFVKLSWYHTKDPHLDNINDTLYYFDHLNNKIITYDENMNLLHECCITYTTNNDFWRYKIYKDYAFNRFYTILGTKLCEIDIITGETKPLVNIDSFMKEKIKIYKGNLYTVTKKIDVLHGYVSYIERVIL